MYYHQNLYRILVVFLCRNDYKELNSKIMQEFRV